jgi:hypothetical protein
MGNQIDRFENQQAPWFPSKTRPWWSLQAFESKQQHEIVLLGSSLMMGASDCADALAFKSIESRCWAHPCNYLIAKIKELTGITTDNFCFALPGQSASDAWCITKTAFIKSRTPKVVIYGISPADFMNSSFIGPSHTEAFKLMHQVGDCSDVEFEGTHHQWEKLDYYIEHHLWLYRHRSDALFFLRQLTDFVMADIFHCDLTRSNLPLAIELQFSLSRPDEYFINDTMPDLSKYKNVREVINGQPVPLISIATNEPVIEPIPTGLTTDSASSSGVASASIAADTPLPKITEQALALLPKPDLTESLNRYTGIFSYFNESSYREQMLCLNRIAKYCQQHQIKLFLVNMPVTVEHFRLIPPKNYQRYCSDVQTIANSTGADFLNLYDPSAFPTTLFLDSNHLNSFGAARFWDILVPKIADELVHR